MFAFDQLGERAIRLFTAVMMRGNQLPVSATRGQFHQHFMSSFCAKIPFAKKLQTQIVST